MSTVLGLLLLLLVAAAAWLLLRGRGGADSAGTPPPAARLGAGVREGMDTGAGAAATPASPGDGATGAPAPADSAARPAPPDELTQLRLLAGADLDAATDAWVEQVCAQMPEPNPVQRHLATGLDEPEDLVQVVSSDAGLTAEVLRSVNSPVFALAEPITSVRHAITFLGINIVKGIVLRAALAENDSAARSREQDAALARIWQSACCASAVVQLIAQELGRPRASVIGTRALFFNLGDVALLNAVPAAPSWYREGVSVVERLEAQQAACGANAPIIGGRLARRWGLPEEIARAVETAYLPLVTPPQDFPLQGDARVDALLLYLAGRIGDRVAYGGLRDLAALEIAPSSGPGLYYLRDHLEQAGLAALPGLLQSPGLRRKANRLLDSFRNPG
mgnify:CR=1 FL=1